MSLLGSIRSAFAVAMTVPEQRGVRAATGDMRVATTSEELADILLGNKPGTVTDEGAMRVAAAYRCTTLISGAVATMPLSLKRRLPDGSREDASDHPLFNVLRRRPNQWQTPSQFKRYLQLQLLHRGAGFAMIARSGSRIVGLIPLAEQRMKVRQLDDMTLAYRYTPKNGMPIDLSQREVMHLVGHTLDGVNGMSVLGAARDAIGIGSDMQTHSRALFRNGTRVDGTLTHPGELGDEAQIRLRDNLETYRGTDNAGKLLILEEGMKYERMGMSMADAQFVEQSGYNRAEIAMFFGVPPHMIGHTSNTTSWGTGIEQQSLGFVTYTLQDWLTTWEETIARDLIDARTESDLFPWFNQAGLVRGDLKTRTDAYSKYRQWGIFDINEIRRWENENARDGGDNLFAGGNGQAKQSGAADDGADPANPDDSTGAGT